MRVLLLFAIMALACTMREDEPPVEVLTRDRFENVLLEAQLIEARMNHEVVVAHVNAIPAEQYYAEMFVKEGTTKEEFQRSFAYYSEHPEVMRSIYERVLEELNRRKDQPIQ